MYIEECSLQEAETTADSSILCILMQCSDNSLYFEPDCIPRENLSGNEIGQLDCIILYCHLKESFLCSWDCSSESSEGYNLLSSSRAGDAAQPHAQSYCFHSTEQHHLLRLGAWGLIQLMRNGSFGKKIE